MVTRMDWTQKSDAKKLMKSKKKHLFKDDLNILYMYNVLVMWLVGVSLCYFQTSWSVFLNVLLKVTWNVSVLLPDTCQKRTCLRCDGPWTVLISLTGCWSWPAGASQVETISPKRRRLILILDLLICIANRLCSILATLSGIFKSFFKVFLKRAHQAIGCTDICLLTERIFKLFFIAKVLKWLSLRGLTVVYSRLGPLAARTSMHAGWSASSFLLILHWTLALGLYKQIRLAVKADKFCLPLFDKTSHSSPSGLLF